MSDALNPKQEAVITKVSDAREVLSAGLQPGSPPQGRKWTEQEASRWGSDAGAVRGGEG